MICCAGVGAIPSTYGLGLIFGSVNVGIYKPSVVGTVMEVSSAGYMMAYQIALLAALKRIA